MTELNVLQRQQNKGVKVEKEEGEGSCLASVACRSNCYSERQATSHQRSTRERERIASESPKEIEDYSG